MFSGNKTCISTVLFYQQFQRPFRNFLSTPEALWEARLQLCSFTLETEAPVCPGQVLKAAGSQQGWTWTPPGVAHPLSHVMLSQHHCHLTCRSVSLLSPTFKHLLQWEKMLIYCPFLKSSTNTPILSKYLSQTSIRERGQLVQLVFINSKNNVCVCLVYIII